MVRRFFQHPVTEKIIVGLLALAYLGGGTAWGGVQFLVGMLSATLLFQIAYRCQHGRWFDY